MGFGGIGQGMGWKTRAWMTLKTFDMLFGFRLAPSSQVCR